MHTYSENQSAREHQEIHENIRTRKDKRRWSKSQEKTYEYQEQQTINKIKKSMG
jgi:predicted RND superfamily exporter protein